MSDENKDALTPVKANEKKEITSEEQALVKRIKKELGISEIPTTPKEMEIFITKLVGKALSKHAGSSSVAFGEMVFNQLGDLILTSTDMDQLASAEVVQKFKDLATKFITLLSGISPKDQIEGMLATQMIGIHYATMDALANARSFKNPDIKNSFLNSSAKLSRTFAAQMEALNRHRGKGQQKMTVEHVHVNAGGQAIIGNVQSGGQKKKIGGGSNGG